MTNNQKKTVEILEAWTSLKEKIGELVDHLESQKAINEQIITNYQNKLRTKENLIRELEEREPSEADSFLLEQIISEVRLMTQLPINVSGERLLETLKNLRKDYRLLKGFDSGE